MEMCFSIALHQLACFKHHVNHFSPPKKVLEKILQSLSFHSTAPSSSSKRLYVISSIICGLINMPTLTWHQLYVETSLSFSLSVSLSLGFGLCRSLEYQNISSLCLFDN